MIDNEEVIKSKGKYLSDFMTDLPDNVMLNKVITGCGMTQLTLFNDVKYVLAVPYVALIKNKIKSCKKKGITVCDVYSGGSDENDIMAFTGDKIITTYDSLGIVTNVLDKKGVLMEWKVCIDEAHKLVDSASFRPRAINNVLNNYKKYKSFVFGTATPVPEKYQLPALRGITKCRIDWDSNLVTPFHIFYHMYPKRINDVLAVKAMEYLSGENPANAHFFINSVKSITAIVAKLIDLGSLDHTDVKIVCAENSRNLNLIKDSLSNAYAISSANDAPRTINFYTSTAFEGCDIEDKNGQTYIIVDGTKDYTKISTTMMLPQIAGRIRDSIYKNTVELIYSSNTLFTRVSESEYEKTIKNHLEVAGVDVKALNSLHKDSRLRKKLMYDNDDIYTSCEGDKFIVNENAMYNEMYNFITIHSTYRTGENGIEEGEKKHNGSKYIFHRKSTLDISHITSKKPSKSTKHSFRKLVDTYHHYDLMSKRDPISKGERFKADVTMHTIENINPLVGQSIRTLGYKKIKKLDFRKTLVKKELLIRDALVSSNSKIVSILKLKTGDWISRAVAKQKIQTIYNDLAISKTAKATDLNDWYTVKERYKYIDGKKTTGYSIVSCNIKTV